MSEVGMAIGHEDGRLLGENKSLNQLAKEIHENAVAHGWWEGRRTFAEVLALCHSELSEALEEYRDGKPMLYCEGGYAMNEKCRSGKKCSPECFRGNIKPEGVAVEMADCMIRILDWCGREGIDIDAIMKLKMEYNRTRAYKHGGKRL